MIFTPITKIPTCYNKRAQHRICKYAEKANTPFFSGGPKCLYAKKIYIFGAGQTEASSWLKFIFQFLSVRCAYSSPLTFIWVWYFLLYNWRKNFLAFWKNGVRTKYNNSSISLGCFVSSNFGLVFYNAPGKIWIYFVYLSILYFLYPAHDFYFYIN